MYRTVISLCLRSLQICWAPELVLCGFAQTSVVPSVALLLSVLGLKLDGRVRIPTARSGHDEEGTRLQFMMYPLTFIWAYIISEHKINFSGEVGQIKQLVPVFFSRSLRTAATPQKWALLHAMCLHTNLQYFTSNKNKRPNLVIALIWCHLGFYITFMMCSGGINGCFNCIYTHIRAQTATPLLALQHLIPFSVCLSSLLYPYMPCPLL